MWPTVSFVLPAARWHSGIPRPSKLWMKSFFNSSPTLRWYGESWTVYRRAVLLYRTVADLAGLRLSQFICYLGSQPFEEPSKAWLFFRIFSNILYINSGAAVSALSFQGCAFLRPWIYSLLAPAVSSTGPWSACWTLHRISGNTDGRTDGRTAVMRWRTEVGGVDRHNERTDDVLWGFGTVAECRW